MGTVSAGGCEIPMTLNWVEAEGFSGRLRDTYDPKLGGILSNTQANWNQNSTLATRNIGREIPTPCTVG